MGSTTEEVMYWLQRVTGKDRGERTWLGPSAPGRASPVGELEGLHASETCRVLLNLSPSDPLQPA